MSDGTRGWACQKLRYVAAGALLLFLSAQAQALELKRGPYVVDASSVSAQICWRQDKTDLCESLAGLAPGTTFTYQIPGFTGRWTGRALPREGAALRFAAFGDSGSGAPAQYRVASVLEQADPDLVLILGDIIYPEAYDWDYDPKYFHPYARLLPRIPFFPTPGNHDYGSPWKSSGQRRIENTYFRIHHRPKFYSFDAGPAHFVSLDTNEAYWMKAAEPVGPDSLQRRWLENDLARSKARWKFVFMHIPLYTTIQHHGDNAYLRRSLEPLFQKYGVDIVFAGHDHFYERSRPVGGVAYVIAGTGGGELSGVGLLGHIKAEWLEKRVVSYGLVVVDVASTGLKLRFLDDAGKTLDSVEITKR